MQTSSALWADYDALPFSWREVVRDANRPYCDGDLLAMRARWLRMHYSEDDQLIRLRIQLNMLARRDALKSYGPDHPGAIQ